MSTLEKVEAFRAQLSDYMRTTRRADQTSILFDLPLRSMLGGACYFENLPEMLAKLDREPEEIGARMRRLGFRPYLMHVNSLMFGYLAAAGERAAAGAGWALEDDRAALVVSTWERTMEAYREEGTDFSRGRQRVIDEAALEDWMPRLDAAVGRHSFAREVGLLQSYNFLLHGESRDGLFDHGPYAIEPASCVVVKELGDLQGGLHAWAGPSGARDLPVDRVVALRRVALAADALAFDMFGTMAAPSVGDFAATITHELVLAGPADPDVPLVAIDELTSTAELAARVRDVNRALLSRFSDFAAAERISYGVDMYANMVVGFGRIGCDDPVPWEAELRERFATTGATALERLRSDRAAIETWRRLGAESR